MLEKEPDVGETDRMDIMCNYEICVEQDNPTEGHWEGPDATEKPLH